MKMSSTFREKEGGLEGDKGSEDADEEGLADSEEAERWGRCRECRREKMARGKGRGAGKARKSRQGALSDPRVKRSTESCKASYADVTTLVLNRRLCLVRRAVFFLLLLLPPPFLTDAAPSDSRFSPQRSLPITFASGDGDGEVVCECGVEK